MHKLLLILSLLSLSLKVKIVSKWCRQRSNYQLLTKFSGGELAFGLRGSNSFKYLCAARLPSPARPRASQQIYVNFLPDL